MKPTICIIGLGYIGLPTAVMLAKSGCDVLGVDVNPKVIEALKKGEVIIEEPFLAEAVQQVVAEGKLKVSHKPKEADVFIITVPTPILSNKGADMSYVEKATESLLEVIKKGDTVILESTSRVGATEELVTPILEKTGLHVPQDICVGYCPERVLPGKILEELVYNSRIIGGIDAASAKHIKSIYELFVKGELYVTSTKTAEMCKIMENTFRDVNIALANELAKVCEVAGINVWEVIALCNKHPRVNFLSPGPGVGGHCLAVDPWFLVEDYPEIAKLICLSRQINDSMPAHVFERIQRIVPQADDPKKICILGMTYKPDIDDIRESPIVELIHLLEDNGYEVAVVDPYVDKNVYSTKELVEACKESELIVLGVQHQVFQEIPFSQLAPLMNKKNILDTRHFLDREEAKKAGFTYYELGV
ncbi:MAG: nucleotide sugar dehydrogenase [Cellulosilyticaceae bacterium]